MCIPKLDKTLIKFTFPCDIYKYMYVQCPASYTSKTNLNNNQHEEIEVIDLDRLNKLIMTSANTQPEPYPLASTNLLGNQIHMSNLDTEHRQYSITPDEKFH